MTLQILSAMMIAVLIVGVFAGCTTTAPDMTQAEAINITNLAVKLDKKHARKVLQR